MSKTIGMKKNVPKIVDLFENTKFKKPETSHAPFNPANKIKFEDTNKI